MSYNCFKVLSVVYRLSLIGILYLQGLICTNIVSIKAATKTRLSFPLGSDSRLRLWDIDSGCNTLVNFEAMRLQTGKPLQLAVTDDPSLAFVPCMASIKVCCCLLACQFNSQIISGFTFYCYICIYMIRHTIYGLVRHFGHSGVTTSL